MKLALLALALQLAPSAPSALIVIQGPIVPPVGHEYDAAAAAYIADRSLTSTPALLVDRIVRELKATYAGGVNTSETDLQSIGHFVVLANNRLRDNTAGAINLGDHWVEATSYAHITTDTGGAETDYIAAGSGDFRLAPASPARATGFPEPASIGALQPAAGGGGETSHAFLGL